MPGQPHIPNFHKKVPDAYHGTDKISAAEILRSRKFKYGTNGKLYLGDGVYFYESSLWHAQTWAERKYPRNDCAIIQAEIDLGHCLDLHNFEHREFLKQVRSQLKSYADGITDALVINWVVKYGKVNIDTVRATYTCSLYGKIFKESRFNAFEQLIICVKNSNNILKISLVA